MTMRTSSTQSRCPSRVLLLALAGEVAVSAWDVSLPSTALAAHCGPGPRVHRVHPKHMTCNAGDREIRAYYRKANRPSLVWDNGADTRRIGCHAGKPAG